MPARQRHRLSPPPHTRGGAAVAAVAGGRTCPASGAVMLTHNPLPDTATLVTHGVAPGALLLTPGMSIALQLPALRPAAVD